MKVLPIFLTLVLALQTHLAFGSGGDYADEPEPGEVFSHFFTRITKGGLFRGITLEAPKKFQDSFDRWIFRPTWNDIVDRARRDLQAQGVDLWGDWYRAPAPLRLIAPTEESQAELGRAILEAEEKDAECAALCRRPSELSSAPWTSMNVHERQAFTQAMVLGARLYQGKSLIEFLASEYEGSAEQAISHSELKLLDAADFEKAVRKIGWDGPIYFRGITAPAPDDPSHRWILMNDDLMKKMTPFDSAIVQSLEYVGIFAHEMSHVLQDQAAATSGINLTVKSPEGALLLEGEAEFLTESALTRAGKTLSYPSALLLFVAEQGAEIANRPGQAQQGNLFPYTVGVPFAATLFNLTPPEEKANLRLQILRTLDERQTLGEMLRALF